MLVIRNYPFNSPSLQVKKNAINNFLGSHLQNSAVDGPENEWLMQAPDEDAAGNHVGYTIEILLQR